MKTTTEAEAEDELKFQDFMTETEKTIEVKKTEMDEKEVPLSFSGSIPLSFLFLSAHLPRPPPSPFHFLLSRGHTQKTQCTKGTLGLGGWSDTPVVSFSWPYLVYQRHIVSSSD